MLGNFLIGLREGLEAAIVVSILIAYLIKINRRDQIRSVWIGVGLALVLCIGFTVALAVTSTTLSDAAQEAFAGVVSLVAVGTVTWMIFWMKKASRALSGELRRGVDEALVTGATALVTLAFIAVAREGLETAIFIWSAIQATGVTAGPVIGGILGLLAAVALEYLIYNQTVKLNISTFFRWTGVFLILVAAGVLMYAIHEFQELGWLPGEDNIAFDVSSTIPPDSWYGTVLKGAINFTPAPSVLQVVAWVSYVIPIMVLFFLPPKRSTSTPEGSPQETAPAAS
ncbi:MAG TPA: iron transporter [Actinobacteria bacterium]|nr:iron transporter [Actinomycetota bacterium]